MAYDNIPWMHLRVGQVVCRTDDEHHTGRVEAVHNSVLVKVRWHGTSWLSFESAADLERVR